MEAVPSHGLYTEPTLRDVSFRDVSSTLAMLSWTVDGVTEAKLVSVEMFVKKLFKTGDVLWESLLQLSFNHPVTGNSTHAIRFQRDLNVGYPGQAYRANVTLYSGIKNMTSTVDVTTVPYGPKIVHLDSLDRSHFKELRANFGYNRIDAYFGEFEQPDTKLALFFGPVPLDSPLFTNSAVSTDINLPFHLVPGQTYRVVIGFNSWGRRSTTLTGSNYKTVAPSVPVIDQVQRLSNGSLRVTWMLSTGIADIFLVTVNGKKHVIRESSHVTSAGRYSADINGLKNEPSYIIQVTAESNRTKGLGSFTFNNTDGVFSNAGERDTTTASGTKPPSDDVRGINGNVITPWVISGILFVIVLSLAVVLGITIKKFRQSRYPTEESDYFQTQNNYDTIRTSYLHPI